MDSVLVYHNQRTRDNLKDPPPVIPSEVLFLIKETQSDTMMDAADVSQEKTGTRMR